KCIKYGKGESFLKYHKVKTSHDVTNKVLPSSQPLIFLEKEEDYENGCYDNIQRKQMMGTEIDISTIGTATVVLQKTVLHNSSNGHDEYSTEILVSQGNSVITQNLSPSLIIPQSCTTKLIKTKETMPSTHFSTITPSTDKADDLRNIQKSTKEHIKFDDNHAMNSVIAVKSTSVLQSSEIMCEFCRESFKSKKGLGIHYRYCKSKILVPFQNIPISEKEAQIPQQSYQLIESFSLKDQIMSAYESVIKWRKNIFQIPKGNSGKLFVAEITNLIDAWCDNSNRREFAFYAIAVMPHLLLQKTYNRVKAKENKETLIRRLEMWKIGKIDELFREGEALQNRLPKIPKYDNSIAEIAKRFKNLVVAGKINAALRLLDNNNNSVTGAVLPINDDTYTLLSEKHPNAEPKFQNMLLEGPIKNVEAAIFDSITPELIQQVSLKTKGSAGPSLMDADEWKRIIGSKLYGTMGTDLCKSIARLAKILSTEELKDPKSLTALMACRLIPLDKNPGLRPIGIGEVLRRIIGKAITYVLRPEMRSAAGGLQLCVGLEGGAEAGIHGMRHIFEDEETEGIIQVDANNAFNTINRNVLLHNIWVLCPELATYANNCYAEPARLFVTGGIEISSVEGTTQGDPIAMPLYAIGLLPLMSTIINHMADKAENLKQAAFADDLTGAGNILALKIWWDMIIDIGKFIGYIAKPSKSWLIVKDKYIDLATFVFKNAGINITSRGKRHLGAVIGSDEFKEEYIAEKIDKWILEIEILADIALIEPHAAYAAFIHGFQHKFTFTMRTIPDISAGFKRLDDVITNKLIKNIFNRECTEIERKLFALPVRLGGLGMNVLSEMCEIQYKNSVAVTESLVENVVNQQEILEIDEAKIKSVKNAIKVEKVRRNLDQLANIKVSLNAEKNKLLEAISEAGASSWLNAIPLKQYGFHLDKEAFRDVLFLRYGIPMKRLPQKCVCGASFNEVHALNCSKGGFVLIRHNDIRDLTAELLSEICKDVSVEPILTPLTGETFVSKSAILDDDARCDVAARGFWVRGRKAYLDQGLK
ncbi:MAG: hypothetical protein MK200_06040, partial [Nitrosopumilus sp.]|nr:hypothetical protein [Nitrosopumilus sp.]